MSIFKLYYFHARGVGELSRMIFAVAGRKYEDVRYSQKEWQFHRHEMPLKTMPVLEVDGKKICQSSAIARYLAREFGLYGTNNMEALKIDEIYETVLELGQSFIALHLAQSAEEKAKLMKPLLEQTYPCHMNFLEMRLLENNGGKGFMVGNEISLADIALFSFGDAVKRFTHDQKTDLLVAYPELNNLFNRVAGEPRIAEWLKRRPTTEF